MKFWTLIPTCALLALTSFQTFSADLPRGVKPRGLEDRRPPAPRKTQEPWAKWAREPATLRMTVTAENIYAATNANLFISLADAKVITNGIACDTPMGNSVKFVTNLKIRKEFLLSVIASNFNSMNLQLDYEANWVPSDQGRRQSRPKTYRLLVDRMLSTDGTINIFNPNECGYYSNVWRIEINEHLPANWMLDDFSNDATKAPGDGTFPELGPGKSLDKSQAPIRWSVGLGRIFDGTAAGRLTLLETNISVGSYTATNLYYTASTELLRDAVRLITLTTNSALLRQVQAYQTFVDIVSIANGTEMRFYFPAQVGTGTNDQGHYTNFTGNPFVVWALSNPNPPNNNTLHIIERRNGVDSTNEIIYDAASTTATWTSRYGKGAEQRVETRGVAFTTNAVTNRIETVDVRYTGAAVPAYRAVETYRLFPWGFELVEVRIDPDNNAGTSNDLVTSFAFYEDNNAAESYGKPWISIQPDGFWEKRIYDDSVFYGALRYVLHPDRDSPSDPTNATISDCLVDAYEYDWVTGEFKALVSRYKSESGATSFRVNLMWRNAGYISQSLDLLSTPHLEEGVGNFGGPNADGPGFLGTTTYSPDESWGLGYFGHDFSRQDTTESGVIEVSYMVGGTYNPTNYTFANNMTTPLDGPDWRLCTMTTGQSDSNSFDDTVLAYSAEGEDLYLNLSTGVPLYPYQSTRETSIFWQGSLAQRELHIFTGLTEGEPQFALVGKWVYQNDSLGHATNILWIDGSSGVSRAVFNADYRGTNVFDGELLLSQKDEHGKTTFYGYDSLKRLVATRLEGVAAGAYPAQLDQTNIVSYDAFGRPLANTNSSGGLVSWNTKTYDVAGRVISQTDAKGLTTTIAYELGGRRKLATLPSGATEIREAYLDRRLKSVTGTGVVNQFHNWEFVPLQDRLANPFLHWVTTLHTIVFGTTNSTRIVKEGIDWVGRTIMTQKPDGVSTNPIVTYTGYFSWHHEIPNCFYTDFRGMSMPMWVEYFDFTGSSIGRSVPIEDDAKWSWDDESSKHRMTKTRWQFVNQGGSWFKVTTNWTYLTDNSAAPSLVSISEERLNGFSSSTSISSITIWDADTNAATKTVYLDRSAKKITEVLDIAQSVLNATNVFVNGLLQTESTVSVGALSRHYYDALGRETSMSSPLGFTASQTYNQYGQLLTKTDFTGSSVTYEYYLNGMSGAGQVKSKTRMDGKKTYFSFNSRGELSRIWGDVPYPEERVYNLYGEMVELHTYRSGSSWSASSWPLSTGSTNITTWQYNDASGLLVSKTDDAGRSVSYTYTNGMLRTRAWARGVSSTNTFTEVGDVQSILYSDSTPPVVFTNFNRAGAPRRILDAVGARNLGYDQAGRLVSITSTQGIHSGTTLSNHYHNVYGRDALSVIGLSTNILQVFGYDTFGRCASAAFGPYSANYTYKSNSDLLEMTACKVNSTTVLTSSRIWEYGGRLQSIVNSSQNVPLSGHSYVYDAVNRRVRDVVEDGSLWQYEYGDRDELLAARHFWTDWTPVAGQQFEYGYDHIGNRVSTKQGGDDVGAGLRVAGYSANNLNQYTNRTVSDKTDIMGTAYATASVSVNGSSAYRKGEYYHCATPVNNAANPTWHSVTNTAILSGTTNTVLGNLLVPPTNQVFHYDLDGNLTNDSVWVYLWDGENRLVQASNLTTLTTSARRKVDFVYDYLGRRSQKIVSTNSGSAWLPVSTNRLIYNGWNPIASFDPQLSLGQSWLWGMDLSGTTHAAGGVGGLLLVTMGSALATNAFAGYDGNGNITVLANATNGSVAARYDYSPYGELIRVTGPLALANAFRFSTKYWDEETGLMDYGRRFYSPSLGRWINRDPKGENGGRNLMAFCGNEPIGRFDSNGLDIFEDIANALTGYEDEEETDPIDEIKDELSEYSEMTGYIEAIKSNERVPSSVSYAASRERLGSRVSNGAWALVDTFRTLGDAALNVANGVRSKPGTALANAEDFILHVARGESIWAELDAITLAVQVGGTVEGALIAWGALGIIIDVAME